MREFFINYEKIILFYDPIILQ